LYLKLEQKDVAKMIQVSKDTICLWENNRCQPGLRFYPAIMDFLGYCPWGHLQTWGERLNRCRTYQGLSLAQFAQELGVDPGTLARQLKKKPSVYFKKKIAEFQKIIDEVGLNKFS
jgi:transcriptional regulator with XRE-family HTH domain